jgi:uncharacterized protein YbjT (DUF2867 family)
MKIALISGTSGLVGMQLLHQLLKNPDYSYIISLGRRKLSLKHEKLVQLVADMSYVDSMDWETNLTSQSLGGEYNSLRDSIVGNKAEIHAFCALGTTIKQAGSKEKFYKVDHNFVISFAKWAHKIDAKKFLYISALGADPTSSVYYNKVKGEVEADLTAIHFDYLGLFRPSLLLGSRHEFRLGEEVAKIFTKPLVWLKLWKSMRPIHDYQVAKAMVKKAMSSNNQSVEIITSGQMQDLSA